MSMLLDPDPDPISSTDPDPGQPKSVRIRIQNIYLQTSSGTVPVFEDPPSSAGVLNVLSGSRI